MSKNESIYGILPKIAYQKCATGVKILWWYAKLHFFWNSSGTMFSKNLKKWAGMVYWSNTATQPIGLGSNPGSKGVEMVRKSVWWICRLRSGCCRWFISRGIRFLLKCLEMLLIWLNPNFDEIKKGASEQASFTGLGRIVEFRGGT